MKTLLLAFFIFCFVFTISNGIEFTIKQDNKTKTIDATQTQSGFMAGGFVFDNNAYLQVEFNEITPQKVKEFESKYNLELKQVMVIGAYIYKHNSDIFLLLDEISKEKNIKSAKPLWANTKAVLY